MLYSLCSPFLSFLAGFFDTIQANWHNGALQCVCGE
jgi:hypothetical protein